MEEHPGSTVSGRADLPTTKKEFPRVRQAAVTVLRNTQNVLIDGMYELERRRLGRGGYYRIGGPD